MTEMAQVKSTAQSVRLNEEKAAQLDMFVNLLVDLEIIGSPEQVFSQVPVQPHQDGEANNYRPEVETPLESNPIMIMEATLETPLSTTSNIPQQVAVEPIDVLSDLEEEVNTPLEHLEEKANIPSTNSVGKGLGFDKLQDILFGPELSELQAFAAKTQENLAKLEEQIYEPQKLIDLLLPCITELLKQKIVESQSEMVQAISPIVDQAILMRVEQDKNSMSTALSPAIPRAIAQQIQDEPEEFANVLGPTMGRAMKKQVELSQDSIVDALYPIIGSTISKYMAETIRAINKQVEETLSVEGITRKIRAKLQGVSEAELILKEAMPFAVQAIFLIHKGSGLIIADIQRSDAQQLESEMLAGMLTAIRSFANDCFTQSGSVSELDAIDYGTSKIFLEVAGYCYLALVVRGEPPKIFIGKVRQTLSQLVKDYGKLIEEYDGDPDSIPPQVPALLESLKDDDIEAKQRKNQPSPLVLLALTIFGVIFLPWGIWQYQSGILRQTEEKTSLALASTPELSVYRLTTQGDSLADAIGIRHKLNLSGRVPNQYLRVKAEEIVKKTVPNWSIDNHILSVEIPAEPVLAAAEVKRVSKVLNQTDGTAISARYVAGKVIIDGTVSRISDAKTINIAFEQIPGVTLVSSTVQVQPLQIDVQFYFEPNSSTLTPGDLKSKIEQVKVFLEQHPQKHLKINGYSYDINGSGAAQHIALERSQTVQKALIEHGIEQSRLQAMGTTDLPPGINLTQEASLSRCVLLELIDK
jgi:outer membrane protein OmpA-like peptidoglycan-associated protein